ncbi:DUF6884 domain-containing protein [Streptomyces diastaticus]
MTDVRPDLVVISCGGKKRPHPAPAGHLYTGGYFTSCRDAARSLRPVHGWLILSALHGFLRPATVIEPYDQRMGQPDSVTPARLLEQATAAHLLDLRHVVVLAPKLYADAARTVWPDACTPLVGLAGLGYQRQLLARIQMRGHVECTP